MIEIKISLRPAQIAAARDLVARTGPVIVLLTVIRKTRSAETAEVVRAPRRAPAAARTSDALHQRGRHPGGPGHSRV